MNDTLTEDQTSDVTVRTLFRAVRQATAVSRTSEPCPTLGAVAHATEDSLFDVMRLTTLQGLVDAPP